MADHPADQAEKTADVSRPEASTAAASRRKTLLHAGAQLTQVLVLTAVCAAVLVGWAWWQAGSFSLDWVYLQGERLFFDPLHVVIEDAPGGKIVERTVRVLNRSSSNVTLLCSQQSCGCITLDEFPITIPAGHERPLHLKFGIPSEPGAFEHTVKIFSDVGGYESTALIVSGSTHLVP